MLDRHVVRDDLQRAARRRVVARRAGAPGWRRSPAALRAAGAENVLVDWADRRPARMAKVDLRGIVLAVSYKAALDDALAEAAGAVDWGVAAIRGPTAACIDWRPGSACRRRRAVVLSSLDRKTYLDRDPYADDGPNLSMHACYAGLVDAGVLVGVDWKSTRAEAVEALGGLADRAGQPGALRRTTRTRFARRCARFGRIRAMPAATQPGNDRRPWDAATRGGRRRHRSCWAWENGDTPGYLACREAVRAGSASPGPRRQRLPLPAGVRDRRSLGTIISGAVAGIQAAGGGGNGTSGTAGSRRSGRAPIRAAWPPRQAPPVSTLTQGPRVPPATLSISHLASG
jgi:hypothetical protein